jgi:hypothetical protein
MHKWIFQFTRIYLYRPMQPMRCQLKLGQEPSNCEEISAAARTQVPFHQVGVEIMNPGFEAGRQNATGLDEAPGLSLDMSQTCKSSPVDQVCIVVHGQQVEQRLVKSLVFPAPAGKDSLHGGKSMAASGSEAGGSFAADASQAVSLKQFFSRRSR